MKTKAIRLYGKQDLRLEEFELPAIKDDEILVHIISDSVCMSTYKATMQGPDHKRVPDDVAEKVKMISREDVISAAKGINLHTVYKLMPENKEAE